MVAMGHVSEVPIRLDGRGQSDASRSLMALRSRERRNREVLVSFSPKLKSSRVADRVTMTGLVHRNCHKTARDVGWFAVEQERGARGVVVTSNRDE